MSRRALVIGTGQIGRAVAASLAGDGWRVTAAQRSATGFPPELATAGVQPLALDREDGAALSDAVAGGVDAVVDTVAFHGGHARQWLGLQDRIGALAVISTGSVYADDQGRTFDEARGTGFPAFPVPIPEHQPRAKPGPATYSTRKVELEDALLDGMRRPLTILRPFAVHGPGSRSPREWWFIARANAAEIPLAYDGQSRFHTAAAANIAELCRVALGRPGAHVLNAADPEALTVAEIGRAILDALGSSARLTPFHGPPRKLEGATPWSIPGPVVADMSAAAAPGYRPVTNYRAAVGELCRALLAAASETPGGWREAFPGLAPYPAGMFT